MSNATLVDTLRAEPARTRDWLALNFALTVFVSAFLLFQIEPLISKFILPWFGGSPAVWTTCLLFFQIVLFCGYAYAHLSTRFLAPRARVAVHCTLLTLSLAFLHVAPGEQYKPLDASNPTALILGLLSATVGLPYFAHRRPGRCSRRGSARRIRVVRRIGCMRCRTCSSPGTPSSSPTPKPRRRRTRALARHCFGRITTVICFRSWSSPGCSASWRAGASLLPVPSCVSRSSPELFAGFARLGQNWNTLPR